MNTLVPKSGPKPNILNTLRKTSQGGDTHRSRKEDDHAASQDTNSDLVADNI